MSIDRNLISEGLDDLSFLASISTLIFPDCIKKNRLISVISKTSYQQKSVFIYSSQTHAEVIQNHYKLALLIFSFFKMLYNDVRRSAIILLYLHLSFIFLLRFNNSKCSLATEIHLFPL
jgi:hypothetical protein